MAGRAQANDREISCEHCGDAFVFTGGEQAFYAEKRFPPPKRCPDCRKARKVTPTADADLPGAPVEVTCAACGAITQVPFKPSTARPIYCADCFRNR